jgi:hypothetical protein
VFALATARKRGFKRRKFAGAPCPTLPIQTLNGWMSQETTMNKLYIAPTVSDARYLLNEMLEALETDDNEQYWGAFERLTHMHKSLFMQCELCKQLIHPDSYQLHMEQHRDDIRREAMLYNHYITTNGRPPTPLIIPPL